jgi:hypothetical protein
VQRLPGRGRGWRSSPAIAGCSWRSQAGAAIAHGAGGPPAGPEGSSTRGGISPAGAIAIGWHRPADRSLPLHAQYELQLRLDKETPRNHLDMRHRITSDGKRYGKVIDYK